MLEQPLDFTGCSISSFLIHFFDFRDSMPHQRSPLSSHFLWLTGHHAVSDVSTLISLFVTYRTPCCVTSHHSHLIFYDLCDTKPCQRSLLLSLTFPTQSLPREAGDILGVANILTCASVHIANLLPTKRYYLVGSIYVRRLLRIIILNNSLH